MGSRRVCGLSSFSSRALEYRPNSCGAQVQFLCSIWDLPRSEIEPMSPALASGSLAPSHQESPVLILNFARKHIWYQNKICHFKSSEISFSFHDLNRVHHLLKWKLKYPFILHQTIHMIVNNQKHFYLKNCFFLS